MGGAVDDELDVSADPENPRPDIFQSDLALMKIASGVKFTCTNPAD